MKLLSFKLQTGFKPSVSLHVNPHPDCSLCTMNGPQVVASIHSGRFAGDSYAILMERYGEMCSLEGIELNLDLLVRHFTQHFVMQRRL